MRRLALVIAVAGALVALAFALFQGKAAPPRPALAAKPASVNVAPKAAPGPPPFRGSAFVIATTAQQAALLPALQRAIDTLHGNPFPAYAPVNGTGRGARAAIPKFAQIHHTSWRAHPTLANHFAMPMDPADLARLASATAKCVANPNLDVTPRATPAAAKPATGPGVGKPDAAAPPNDAGAQSVDAGVDAGAAPFDAGAPLCTLLPSLTQTSALSPDWFAGPDAGPRAVPPAPPDGFPSAQIP